MTERNAEPVDALADYERHRPQYSRDDLDLARAEMRAQCAALAYKLIREYKASGKVRDAILALP